MFARTTGLLATLAASMLLATASVAADKPNLADRHVSMGLKCESCHGTGDKKVDMPEMPQCAQCHDPKKVSDKTANVKPSNPHDSPHYHQDLECTLCHVAHDKPEVYCNQCHKFDYKMP